jgi:gamma-glutamyl-gamma-aminobutyraldehyde dehydrogenase/4-guanidinobutyraldehyde dehydrogenase/NAD-dependent aldehyde dehydrogenase
MKQTLHCARHPPLAVNAAPFIEGEFVESTSGRSMPTINPATGAVLVDVADCSFEDVDRAVASARRAFEDGRWSRRSPRERKVILQRFAALLDEHRAELALIETLETGKPIRDTLSIDVPKAANMIRWYGEAIDKQYDEVAPTGPATLAFVTREPLGVVGAVIPWNFPLYLAAYKIAPALATGNSLVLKPAEQTSLTALRAAQLAVEAGLPPGVLNVVTGAGSVVGRALGLHMDVDCLAFTGSPRTARAFLVYAGQSNMKKVLLEAGGKSPNIVMGDVRDLDEAAKQAAWGIFYNQGQVCSAGSRLLVERTVREALLEKIVQLAREIRIGDPLDPETQLGALIDEAHLVRVLDFVKSGSEEGAQVLCGGSRVLREAGGFFMQPTILSGVHNRMKVAREEIFGPVLSVIDFEGIDAAVQIANDSEYGLGAAIWSSSIDVALYAARRLRAGQVWVNNYDGSDLTVPWGGFKQSGFGRDKSLHALSEYTALKATWIEGHAP